MPVELDLADFDYELPPERIAQAPPEDRDGARLLVLERETGAIRHDSIRALPSQLRQGDLLVCNATRVVPARLRGHKATGGAAEALLLGPSGAGPGRFRALVRTRGRLRSGIALRFEREGTSCEAEIVGVAPDGEVELAFAAGQDPYAVGETPLPPYIRRETPCDADVERYQTVFARVPGSVAAPTAGLHLSERLLASLEAAGIDCAEVVLHVGAGTFRPLREEDLRAGRLHSEPFELPQETADAVARARAGGGRVVAVGTTSARVLESCARDDGTLEAKRGSTDLFLRPGSRWRAVDALLTNFHLPRSSLLLLVAAFAGREAVLRAYEEAMREGYRFYSYGDAMLVL
ncbi:MAG: tRNA preQ1(34) S-adenosylmethionine ribosyltransferase-isomerase QueA [Myxococcota bacterium]|nr:tRNA preQ1(34) S-adenosylmethionine ribosyltransferase-isomerase QueA [Myxococcota bacterium]